jgi:hypothetical protein
MTDTRNFDRLARAWLDLMPNEAPDRAIVAVLQATETTPQVRPPLGLAIRRFPTMNRNAVLAVAAAAVLVVAVGAALVFKPASNVGGQSPTPSLAPSGAVPGAVLPVGLQHTWMGAYRALPGIQAGAGTSIVFDAAGFRFAQSNQQNHSHLDSRASIAADGGLRLETTSAVNECHQGDVGTYTFGVSSSGLVLTVSAVSDPCAVRASALAGAWYLNGCKRTDELCLGDMDAGTYGSQYLNIHLGAGGQWSPFYGALTYTVPNGWAAAEDWPNGFRLEPTSEYATETKDGATGNVYPMIFVLSQAQVALKGETCPDQGDSGLAHGYADLVSYVQGLPALAVSNVSTFTIGGFPATGMDLRVAPTWTGQCADIGAPSYGYLANGGQGVSLIDPMRQRLILVDTGGGDVVAVVIQAVDAASFDGFVAEAMPIVQTFQFKP